MPASPTTKLFFSHATEDKGRVLQVYGRLIEKYPQLDPWIDTFEIVAGQELLDRIAEGMDEAARFFVFLSPISVGKPWVQAEFKRALALDLSGKRPDYVVPVKMGGLTSVPAFMEGKKYIDLDSLTETEWLGEFYAAATGAKLPNAVEHTPNLIVQAVGNPSDPSLIQYAFQVRHWAEDTGFKIQTSQRAESVKHAWATGGPSGPENYSKMHTDSAVGVTSQHRLTPGRDLRITLKFPPGVEAKSVVGEVQLWDGSGSTESGTLF